MPMQVHKSTNTAKAVGSGEFSKDFSRAFIILLVASAFFTEYSPPQFTGLFSFAAFCISSQSFSADADFREDLKIISPTSFKTAIHGGSEPNISLHISLAKS